MMESKGISLEDGDSIVIPIYIFKNSLNDRQGPIASGEGLIKKIDGRYFGSFGFETFKPLHESGLPPQVSFDMHLVHGSRGQRASIGEIQFTHRQGEFSGSVEFGDDPDLDILMRTARSLVNIPW